MCTNSWYNLILTLTFFTEKGKIACFTSSKCNYFHSIYLLRVWHLFPEAIYESLSSNIPTVPTPIKDVASIQKLFIQPYTMVHFRKISSTFIKRNCTKFNKTYIPLTSSRCRYYSRAFLIGHGMLKGFETKLQLLSMRFSQG